MARDKFGEELQVGDTVLIRAIVTEVHQLGTGENAEAAALIKVDWQTDQMVPLISYIKPGAIEKCPT